MNYPENRKYQCHKTSKFPNGKCGVCSWEGSLPFFDQDLGCAVCDDCADKLRSAESALRRTKRLRCPVNRKEARSLIFID